MELQETVPEIVQEQRFTLAVMERFACQRPSSVPTERIRLERKSFEASPTGSHGTVTRPSSGMPDGIGSPPETTAENVAWTLSVLRTAPSRTLSAGR